MNKSEVNKDLEERSKDFYLLSDKIWENAEIRFKEKQSVNDYQTFLEKEGFSVKVGLAGLKTAFSASWGSGKPGIGFLGEYDALPGLSQKAGVAVKEQLVSEGNGHGCGHNLLGVGSLMGAIGYKHYLESENKGGTVIYFGCPAEEGGSGKTFMAREGIFDNLDVALCWHPSDVNMLPPGPVLANYSIRYSFTGKASHASAAPEAGRSALDACELMNVGVNYLREHMETSDRVHYAYTNVGGKAPNVVQSEACLKYFVRSTTNPKCEALYERVVNVAKGAALMTDNKLEIYFDEALSNVIPNFVLEDVLANSFRKIYQNNYTEEELAYASKFKNTYNIDDVLNDLPANAVDRDKLIENVKYRPINDYFVETSHSEVCNMGSTDVGDVSWVVPCAQINTACYAIGAGAHTWQWVAQGKSMIAYKGAMLAGEVLCDSAITLLNDPELINKAKEEFVKRLDGQKYKCMIPDDVKPHVSSFE